MSSPIISLLQLSTKARYRLLVQQSVIPTIINFYDCIADDYQMKNINLKVLLLLRNKEAGLLASVFELISALVESLKERFLVVTADVVPFLMESASSRDERVSSLVRKIILTIENLSG